MEAVPSTPPTTSPPSLLPAAAPSLQPTRRSKRKRNETNLLGQLFPGIDFSQFDLSCKKLRR
jgi:hypothetical protein